MKTVKLKLRNFARKTLASVLIPVMFVAGNARAKSKDMIKMISTEISYTQNDNIVKFRPFIYTSPDNQRTDLMFGKKFGDYSAYAYWKSDNEEGSWMGVRADKSIKLTDKLSANLQVRYFAGLNDNSANHFYFIPTANYKLDDRFSVGVMGYGKKSEGKDPFFYLGPSVGVKLTDKLSASLTYDKDILGDGGDLLFLNFGYKH